jgi:glycerol kinase
MHNHYESVREAEAADDLAFGTVESWIVYVSNRTEFHDYKCMG